MAKYFLATTIVLLFGCLLMPLQASALWNMVQFEEATDVYLTGRSLTLTISSGGNVAGMTVYAGYVRFEMESGSSVVVTSGARKTLSNNVGVTTECTDEYARVTFSSTENQTIDVTPGDTCGGGGGGGGAVVSPAPSPVVDTTAPSISDVSVSVSSSTATVSWTTDESSLSWVVYGTSTDYGLEEKTTTYETSHSVTLTNLSPLTTYHYQVKSQDSSDNTGTHTDKTFTTSAEEELVVGEATVTASEGGEVLATTEEGSSAKVTLPTGAVSADAEITVTPVGTAESVGGAPPAGSFMVGGYVYSFTATVDGEEVSEFDEAVTLTFTYTDDQVSDLDEDSLTVHYWDSDISEWVALESTVDSDNNTVTADTTHFSDFVLIGEEAEEEVVGEQEEEEEVTPISEMTIAELKAEIVRIAALIAGLQTQLAAFVGGLTTNLQYDDSGDDVELLQTWLAKDSEVYPEAIVSGWFGPLTKAAVIRFQEKYAEDVLAPWDLTAGTGFVGSTTRDKLNALYGE